MNCERLVARLTRPSVARLLLNNRSLPSVAARRNDSIFTKYREPPNGFLFNEKVSLSQGLLLVSQLGLKGVFRTEN